MSGQPPSPSLERLVAQLLSQNQLPPSCKKSPSLLTHLMSTPERARPHLMPVTPMAGSPCWLIQFIPQMCYSAASKDHAFPHLHVYSLISFTGEGAVKKRQSLTSLVGDSDIAHRRETELYLEGLRKQSLGRSYTRQWPRGSILQPITAVTNCYRLVYFCP
jgi:hypothetical protein